MLFLIIEYLFAVWAYYNYGDDFVNSGCSSLIKCYIISFDQTFKVCIYIYIYIYTGTSYRPEEELAGIWIRPILEAVIYIYIHIYIYIYIGAVRYDRIAYDNLFNLILLILLLQILAGIIIDQFSDLRTNQLEIERDNESGCIICGYSREEIESGKQTFFGHITV